MKVKTPINVPVVTPEMLIKASRISALRSIATAWNVSSTTANINDSRIEQRRARRFDLTEAAIA